MRRFVLPLFFVAIAVACNARSLSGAVPPVPNDRSAITVAADASARVAITISIPNKPAFWGARTARWVSPSSAGLALYAYHLPPYGLPATPPPATLAGYFDVSATSPHCKATASGRTCHVVGKAPRGHDAITAIVYAAYPSPGPKGPVPQALAEATVEAQLSGASVQPIVLTLGGIPAQIALVPSTTMLNNPVSPAATSSPARFTIGAVAIDAAGNTIMTDPYAAPITITVYAPPSVVVPSSGVVALDPTGSIGSPGAKASFRYSGGYFANAMTVTAVAGNASITAQLFPANKPACKLLPTTPAYYAAQPGALTFGPGGGLHLIASIAGSRPHGVQLDTGSTGFIIAKSSLAGADPKQLIGPGQAGQETLEPSGNIEYGHYYLAPVTIFDLQNNLLARTVPMEVLAIEKVCKARGGGCTTPHTALMGVGFGRPTPPPTQPYLKGPLENVFLQLDGIVQGNVHPGYVMTRDSLWVGLNAANATGFSYTNLRPFPFRTGDWSSAPGCLRFNGGAYQCGKMLLDIGIDTMIAAGFSTPSPTRSIAVAAPDSRSPSLQYSFAYPVPAQATPPAPYPLASVPVEFLTSTKSPFVNTGRDALAAADYAYDAGCGRVGFKPRR